MILRALYDVSSLEKDFLLIYSTVYDIISSEAEQAQSILEEMARRLVSFESES